MVLFQSKQIFYKFGALCSFFRLPGFINPPILISNLVKVADNLVEEPDALEALFVDVCLVVELLVVGDGGEHDADVLVPLWVQLLVARSLKSSFKRLQNLYKIIIYTYWKVTVDNI